jgi:hypothetical protein
MQTINLFAKQPQPQSNLTKQDFINPGTLKNPELEEKPPCVAMQLEPGLKKLSVRNLQSYQVEH